MLRNSLQNVITRFPRNAKNNTVERLQTIIRCKFIFRSYSNESHALINFSFRFSMRQDKIITNFTLSKNIILYFFIILNAWL